LIPSLNFDGAIDPNADKHYEWPGENIAKKHCIVYQKFALFAILYYSAAHCLQHRNFTDHID